MEEENAMRPGGKTLSIVSETSLLLTCLIETEEDSLKSFFRSYISQGGIAFNKEDVQEKANELLSEVYIEASRTSDHFDPTRSPYAWLMGIASNILRQKKREMQQRRQHEVTLSDLQRDDQTSHISHPYLQDQLSMLYAKKYEEETEIREEVQYLLSLVSEKDRSLLELCYLQGVDGEDLALELGCSYTAAHTRLYRARQRLRAALTRTERRAL